MKDIVWKDRPLLPYVIVITAVIFDSYIISIIILNRSDIRNHISAFILGILMIALSVYYVIAALLPRTTIILKSGIRVGNIIDDKYDYNIFTFKRKSPYVEWPDIAKIELMEKKVWHTFIYLPKSFLVVHTKKDGEHETYLAQPKGFVKTLATLNKQNLLSADSKFLK